MADEHVEDPDASRDVVPPVAEEVAEPAAQDGDATLTSALVADATTDNAVVDEADRSADAVHEEAPAVVEDLGKSDETVSEPKPEAVEAELAAPNALPPAEAPGAEANLVTGTAEALPLEEPPPAVLEEPVPEDLPPVLEEHPLNEAAVDIDIPPGATGLKMSFVFADPVAQPLAEEAAPAPEEPLLESAPALDKAVAEEAPE